MSSVSSLAFASPSVDTEEQHASTTSWIDHNYDVIKSEVLGYSSPEHSNY